MRNASNKYPRASAYTDRHGKRRWRHRKKGRSTELGTTYDSPEFRQRYKAAESGDPIEKSLLSLPPKSISALVAHYYQTADYQALNSSTKAVYRGILERFREKYGHLSDVTVSRRHIKTILDQKSKTPFAAKKLRHRLKVLFQEAIDLEWRNDNPVAEIRPIKAITKGFYTWTEADIEKFLIYHLPGTVPHTAMILMLYTGAARVDAVQLGWSNIKKGRVNYVRQKTQASNGTTVSIPIHDVLQTVLDTLPRDAETFLQTKNGVQRSSKGLGKDMRIWCNKANLPKCTSHGLRKAIARRLAEAGATTHQIMAITGHATISEVERYTKDADRAKMADRAMEKMVGKFSDSE